MNDHLQIAQFLQVAQFLVESKADVDARTTEYDTAFDLCFTAHNSSPLSSADGPPYTGVLLTIISKLHVFWSSRKLTSMQETKRMPALDLCFTAHNSLSLSSANGPPYTAVL